MRYLFVCLISATAACTTGRQADLRRLSSADTMELHLEAIRAAFDTLNIPSATRLWLRHTLALVPDKLDPQRVDISQEFLTHVQRRFPNARLAARDQRLFLCPPGVTVSMPGQGCPVLDDGVIVSAGPIRVEGNLVLVSASVTRSNRSGTNTWAEGFSVVFRRSGGQWHFVRVQDHSIS